MPEKQVEYLDSNRPVIARVGDLLYRMTLQEKLAQLGSVWVYELLEDGVSSEERAQTCLSQGIGHITRIGGASNLAPAESARLANTIQKFLSEQTRLGIPAIVHEESCGYMALGATCFPQIIGLASTWEPGLATALTDTIRLQMRSVGAHQALAPVLDIVRDPRWGRVKETFGEDPYLTSLTGTAYVRALQGTDLRESILATGKHFLGYGVTEGGMNWAPAHVGKRELLEVFLPPFEAAIKEAGLSAIMNAYHEIDGIPCVSSKEIFTDLLRGELGFDGVVVSDYFAVAVLKTYHHIARDKCEAAVMALEAGIDIELPSTDCYGEPLRQALDDGAVDQAFIEEAVSRILTAKLELGLFENPYVDSEAITVFDTLEQRAVARDIARKSIVLLKNADNLLPLRKDITSLAVIGPNADSERNLLGDYSFPAHVESLAALAADNLFDTPVPDSVSMSRAAVPTVSVLDGIRAAVSGQTAVHYAKGCEVLGSSTEGIAEAVAAARQSDVAVLVVGDKSGLTESCTCGETCDRAELGLPGMQQQLVEAIQATGTRVIVLINGRPLTLPWIFEHVPAVVEAWLPGEEGGSAIADVLFGDLNPGGKLPMSFPRAVDQVPILYNHRPSGGRSDWRGSYVEMSTKPQFAFGYGLSYTHLSFDDFAIDKPCASAGEVIAISVGVTNAGDRAGDEVAQLYVHDAFATITRPLKELKGFKLITLNPGETKTVTFHLAVNQLGFCNREMAYVVEPGQTEVFVGNTSDNIQVEGTFEITGKTTVLDSTSETFFCGAVVT